jgi:hypothetical protein
LIRKPLENRAFGRVRRWEDNIRMDLRETGYEDEMCTDLVQDQVQWQTLLLALLNFVVLLPES